jgi:hypothetical protein
LSSGRSRYPRLSADAISDDSAVLSLVDALFEHNTAYAKHTRKILAAQDRLQALCEPDAWVEYLFLEERVNQRVNFMLALVARWAFNEGRRSRRGWSMSRFRIDHSTDPKLHAMAGVDHAVGPFFVELYREGRDRPIKSLDMFTLGRSVTLQDAIEFLIAERLIDRADLEAALMVMQDGTRVRSKRVRRVVEVVEAFKPSG